MEESFNILKKNQITSPQETKRFPQNEGEGIFQILRRVQLKQTSQNNRYHGSHSIRAHHV